MASTSQSELTAHGIVVAVDGSATSLAAAEWAARDAELRHLPLTVVHVLPPVDVGPWVDLPIPAEYWLDRDRRADKIVATARQVMQDAVGNGGELALEQRVLSGAIVPTLVDLSKDADLVVVGCRGLRGVRGLLLGSVSSGLVHHAHCPVAIIHDEAPAA